MSLILLLAIAVFVGLLVRLVLIRAPRYGKGFLLRLAVILVVLALFGLAISGRLHWLFGLIAAALPFAGRILRWALPLLIRFAPILANRSRASGPSQGQQSRVRSRVLAMTLDHDTGTISGRVMEGPFEGSNLDQLSLSQLKLLYQQCQQDDLEGVKLLDAYIQRHRDHYWEGAPHNEHQANTGSDDQSMNEADALAILGLESGADAEQIRQAHKRLMARLHPDKGGSNYLASKVNQAKELLLRQADRQRT